MIQLVLIESDKPKPHTGTPLMVTTDYWTLNIDYTQIIQQFKAEEKRQQQEEQNRVVGYFYEYEGPDDYTHSKYHLVCVRCVEERIKDEEYPQRPDDYCWERVSHADYENDEDYPQFIYSGGLCDECGMKLVEK